MYHYKDPQYQRALNELYFDNTYFNWSIQVQIDLIKTKLVQPNITTEEVLDLKGQLIGIESYKAYVAKIANDYKKDKKGTKANGTKPEFSL